MKTRFHVTHPWISCIGNSLAFLLILLLTRAEATVAAAQDPLTNGLTAFYPFTGNAQDASGHGYNGTVVGATLTNDIGGTPAAAYFFQGSPVTDSYINCGQAPLAQFEGDFSVCALVWFQGGTANPRILSHGQDFGYELLTEGTADSRRFEAHFALQALLSGHTYPARTWHFVVVTRTGSQLQLFVNGEQDGSAIVAGTPSYGVGLEIGRKALHWADRWGGIIDQVRLYNRALCVGEIRELHSREAHRAHYVAADSPAPQSPFASWATAARTLQEAVDVATAGDEVVVTNGVYATGGKAVFGLMTNRVAVDRPITVRSVNGPEVTLIYGRKGDGGLWCGDDAVRGAYLTNGAVLSGFTLKDGTTRCSGGLDANGGGVLCESPNAQVTNCTFTGNSASDKGGAAYSGTLNNCALTGNSAEFGGGAHSSILKNCFLGHNYAAEGGGSHSSALENCALAANEVVFDGGGAKYCSLDKCLLTGNRAFRAGGGASLSALNDCRLTSNWTVDRRSYGGGAYLATLTNCTLTGNEAWDGGGAYSSDLYNCTVIDNSAGPWLSSGGGVWGGTMINCIVYYNTAVSNLNYFGTVISYCCTTPHPGSGSDTITNEPLFMDRLNQNLRLQSLSPCINTGAGIYVTAHTDLDGRPRTVGGTVDIGAYEFQGDGMGEFIGWLEEHGLPTDGAADHSDPDADGFDNWQEWRCGSEPGDSHSFLCLMSPALAGLDLTLSWASVSNRLYRVDWSTNLLGISGFLPLVTNLPGQPGTTSYTHTNALTNGPRFYRLGVQ